jgi:hypothetical protein
MRIDFGASTGVTAILSLLMKFLSRFKAGNIIYGVQSIRTAK